MGMFRHASVRVPWRDQPWDDKVCHNNALDNSTCLLLRNSGGRARTTGSPRWQALFTELPCPWIWVLPRNVRQRTVSSRTVATLIRAGRVPRLPTRHRRGPGWRASPMVS